MYYFRYRNSFKPYRQGDAHEVMRCVLDAVRMEEIEVATCISVVFMSMLYYVTS